MSTSVRAPRGHHVYETELARHERALYPAAHLTIRLVPVAALIEYCRSQEFQQGLPSRPRWRLRGDRPPGRHIIDEGRRSAWRDSGRFRPSRSSSPGTGRR